MNLKPYKWKKGEGKVGSLAFYCHHRIAVEILTCHAPVRVRYIETLKPKAQRPLRLAAFMPVPEEIVPAYLRMAQNAYWKAEYAYLKAGDALVKAENAYWKAESAYRKAVKRATPALKKWYIKNHPEIDTKELEGYES